MSTCSYCIHLTVLLCLSLSGYAQTWTEQQLDKTLLGIDDEIRNKNWSQVIELGQKALLECNKMVTERDPRCITLLRNINHGYIRTGRFNENLQQIKKAYTLSSSVLGKGHFTTVMSRDYYYKLMLFQERYIKAIPVLLEIIEVEKGKNNDEFKIMEWSTQLYALYGVTEQYVQEEATLVNLLVLTEKLMGGGGEDYTTVAVALAENYCTQKKYYEFFKLVGENKLEVRCPM